MECLTMSHKCDKCSTPTSNPISILNGSIKLCEECAKLLGSVCNKKHVPYKTWIASSGLCGACVDYCKWIRTPYTDNEQVLNRWNKWQLEEYEQVKQLHGTDYANKWFYAKFGDA